MSNTLGIPELPSEFDDYQNNAVPIFVAKATTYGIPTGVITVVGPMKVALDGLVSICKSESTKGPGATANRNEYQITYRDEIESIVTLYLLNNDDVTAADKLTLHIHTPTGDKSPVPAPESTVVGKFSYNEPLAQYFGFMDSISGKKAKPESVAFVQLNYIVDTVAPVSVANCTLNAFINNANKKVVFASTDEGKKAYFYARYVNKNGRFGSWSAMFSGTII